MPRGRASDKDCRMRVAVTGGSGFIGRRLVSRLVERGDEVTVLTRRSPDRAGLPDAVSVHPGDLLETQTDLQGFMDGNDALYHCAGELRDRSVMEELHVAATRRLIEAARGRIRHWVQLSSVGTYGPFMQGVVDENTAEQPSGLYEKTKSASDRLVSEAAQAGAFTCSILRPSIVFGRGMSNQSLCQLARMIKMGVFFFIGPPGASANYIHVDNVVDALLLCGMRGSATARVYIVSDHRTIEQFVGAIARKVNRRVPRIRIPTFCARTVARLLGGLNGFPLSPSRVDALTSRVIYSCTRIQQELGYRHRISIEEGIRELMRPEQQ